MVRVKLLKDFKQWKVGEVLEVTEERARRLEREHAAEQCEAVAAPTPQPEVETAEAPAVAETADATPEVSRGPRRRARSQKGGGG